MGQDATTGGPTKVVSLERISFPRLLFALLHQRFSGSIELVQPAPASERRTIWFSGGMPVFTDWASPPDVLGEVLLEAGAISQEQLVGALQTMATRGGLLGEILIEQGALAPAEIVSGLARQCARKLVHVFKLFDAEVTIIPSHDALAGFAKVGSLELILNGVGAHYTVARVESELGSALYGMIQTTAALSRYHTHFRFRPTDTVILETLSRGSQFEQVSAMRGVSPRRTAQLIYTLWSCQMLRVSATALPRRAATRPPPPVPNPQPDRSRRTGARPAAAPASRVVGGRLKTPLPQPAAFRVSSRPDTATPPPVRATSRSANGPASGPRSAPSTRSEVRAAAAGPSPIIPPPSPPRSAVGPRATSSGSYRVVGSPARATDRPASVAASSSSSTRNPIPVASRPLTRPSTRERTLLQQLEAVEARVERGGNAFEVLGVPASADKAEVRSAWSDLSRKLHPDALAGSGLGHLRRRVESAFAALSEAHMLLSDAAQRDVLRQQVERGEDARSNQDAANTARAAIEGDLAAKEADKLLRSNKFGRALDRYEEALRLIPEDADLEAAALWCRFNISARRRVDAQHSEADLALVLKRSPGTPRAHYFHGLVLKELGKTEAALQAFDEAHELDPRLIDAERQARALRMMRAQAATAKRESRGSRRSLFGKR